MNLCDESLRYATEFHWSILPVIPSVKKPATRHGDKDATTNAWKTSLRVDDQTY